MQHIPLEVHNAIFALTCADGGLAGCSLSRTSRYMRHAVEPFRWHTLAFHSFRQLLRFAKRLPDDATMKRRPMHHLYISCSEYDENDDEHEPLPGRAHQLIARVIRAASPTLRTFSCVGAPAHINEAILKKIEGVAWPQLAEATVQSHAFSDFSLVEWAVSLAQRGVALARVHFVGVAIAPQLYLLVNASLLPRATHVRFSRAETAYLVQMLADHLRGLVTGLIDGDGGAGAGAEEEHPCVARGIEHVVVQSGGRICGSFMTEFVNLLRTRAVDEGLLPEMPPDCDARALDEKALAEDLGALVEEFELRDGLFTVLPPHHYGHVDAYRDWVDRVQGGPGCWDAV